jgi:DNA-binding XRE family transcriptional regulator
VEEQYISYLKKYRQLAELTQEELAEKVGVRRETIVRLEAAKYNPSLKLAVDISRVVGAPIEAIFEFPEDTIATFDINATVMDV